MSLRFLRYMVPRSALPVPGLKIMWKMVLVLAILTTSSYTQINDIKKMSPSKRRAFMRDSLRLERNKKMNNTAKENTKPGNKAAGNPTDTTPIIDSKQQKSVPTAFSGNLPIPDSIMIKELFVRDVQIRDVLTGLAIRHNVNILIDSDVKGRISINLTNISLKKALPLIVTENGYLLTVVQGIIKVRMPPVPEPEPEKEPAFEITLKKGKLTVDIKDIPIERVVRKLVDVSAKTIILGKNAKGTISSYYKNIEFEKALKLIVITNGFKMRENDGVITISKDEWVSSGTDGKNGLKGRSNINVKGNLVTLEVTNAPLAQIVNSITEQGGLSAVIYGNLIGNVTAKLKNISVTQALTYLFRGTDFTFWLKDDIYFIGSKEMKAITNSKLLILKHMKADEIMDLIPKELIKNMKVKVVPAQNAIMTMGTYEAINGLEDYINKIDLPVAQILIEALVIDFDMDKIRNYGVDLFLGSTKNQGPESIYPAFQMTAGKNDTEGFFNGIPGLKDVLSLPKNFVARIEALEQEKVLNVRSRPQIATLNGKTASITVGQTQYFLLKSETDFNQNQSTTTRTQEKFTKIQADVTLTVTPFVTGKGEITVEIIADFSEPEGSFNSTVPPTINRRYLKSTVRLRESETIVLGGLIKEGVNSDRRQFPILGSIPILGWLFKNVNTTRSKTQLMIFVTPHIYYGKDANVDVEKVIKEM